MDFLQTATDQAKPSWGKRWSDAGPESEALEEQYPALAAYLQICRAQATINRPELEAQRLAACASHESRVQSPKDRLQRNIACLRRDVLLDRWFKAEARVQAQYGRAAGPASPDHSTSGALERLEKNCPDGFKAICELDTNSESNIGLYWTAWRKRWCLEGHAARLRSLYHHDRERYRKAFWRQDDIVVAVQDDAMAAFVSMVTRLERRIQAEPYLLAGKAAMEAFASAVASSKRCLEGAADAVFISVDLEGVHSNASVLSGCGIAKLDTKHFLDDDNSERCGIALNCSNPFGKSRKLEPDAIRGSFKENITIFDKSGHRRRVVLVGHGLLSTDLPIMQQNLGIDLDECGVVGYIDTCKLALVDFGHKGTLESLLEFFRIPYRREELHCAGPDAYYTMLVLLAMIKQKYLASLSDVASSGLAKLNRLVAKPSPQEESSTKGPKDEVKCYDLESTFM